MSDIDKSEEFDEDPGLQRELDSDGFFESFQRMKKEYVAQIASSELSYEQLLDLCGTCLAAFMGQQKIMDEMDKDFSGFLDESEKFKKFITESAYMISKEINEMHVIYVADRKLTAVRSLIKGVEMQKTLAAQRNARRKVSADPRQKEKAFVFQCWKEWRADPARYKRKTNFARDMLDKCEHLTSPKTIEDWCREWEKSEPS